MRFDGRLMLIDYGSARMVPAAVHSEITPDYAGEFLVCHHTPTYQCSLT